MAGVKSPQEVVLEKLEAYAKRHPELVDELAKASGQYGPESEEGRKHSDPEHFIVNLVRRIFLN